MNDKEERLKKINHKALIALATSQILVETLDDLKGTNFYRQQRANQMNNTVKVLERFCDEHYDKTWKAEPELMQETEVSIEEILKQIVNAEPQRLITISKMLKKGAIVFVDNEHEDYDENA